jgi:pyruvate dehydrogenase E1 component beta subunit
MRTVTIREALREAMSEEMRTDDRVFLIGEEVAEYNGAYKVSQGMLEEFGAKRVIDTPIAELGFAGIAVGAAMNGLKPIVEFMTFNFSLVAIDPIINAAAKMLNMSGGQVSCPMVFRGPSGSAGTLAAQHSQTFESWYANCPGLKVISISNAYDAKGLLKAAIRDPDPVIFMESEMMYSDTGEIPDGEYIVPIGKANIVKQGTDVTLVSYNKMMKPTIAAAEELEKMGINAEIIDLRTIRPMDMPTIVNSAKKTNRVVVIDESWPFASISSEIAYRIQKDAFDYLDASVIRVNGADVSMPYSKPLVDAYLPDVAKIIAAVRQVTYR